MAIYRDQYSELGELLTNAGSDQGASILIPDLQRPYIWKPSQVIVLVDSLIREWPFGTLLMWKVASNDSARALARTFWRTVDRTDEEEGDALGSMLPPANFQMVLDGQQRVQSLLLAFGGDGWGFKLLDYDWNVDLNNVRARGIQGPRHWSLGCLCVDLRLLKTEYTRLKRIQTIDFQKVLRWSVIDKATCQSNLRKKEDYKDPLPLATSAEWSGYLVRLSRLWNEMPAEENAGIDQAEQAAQALLEREGAKDIDANLIRAVGVLLQVFARLKKTRVNYLELTAYTPALGSKDDYSDAIVNIFTRLNTAGRTLTREDITFAWLKTGWVSDRTGGKSATRCFADLRESLDRDHDISLSIEDLVASITFAWAVQFNGGKLLNNADLLKAESIRPMAEQMSTNWAVLEASMLELAGWVKDRGIKYQEHYHSLSAINYLWTCHFAASRWAFSKGLKTTARDEFDKLLAEALNGLIDRWLICSQWAGRWTSSSGENIAGYASRLAACVTALARTQKADEAVHILASQFEKEVRDLENDAATFVQGELSVGRRNQVRSYYTALWVWSRLDEDRWRSAAVPLRKSATGKRNIVHHVDHVVAYALWDEKVNAVNGTIPPEMKEEMERAVNEIGNCLLLEKDFNISKSKKEMSEFLAQIHEFKNGDLKVEPWAKPLGLETAMLSPGAADLTTLRALFSERSDRIRSDLIAFVRGKKTRVDVDA